MNAAYPEEYDVLIVGYGPVGAALAAMLGSHGVRTLVVDKSPDILMAPRAIALDNEALRILQMAGLQDDAFDKIVIPHVKMHCPYLGQFGHVNTTGSIDGHPKLVTFYQPDLEKALRRRVQAHASVTVATGVEMTSFSQDATGVRARLLANGGTPSIVSARYLVGADGAGSRVRKAIGQDFTGQTYAEDWLIVDAKNVPENIDHVEFICDHRRPTPHMVAPGGRTRWEFMLRPGETREEMEKDETLAELLKPWAKAGDIEIERKAVYRFHARSCTRYHQGRVFLVGDAAHITPPFVGQGLVAGLRDAANLSWKLAWVLQGRANASILDSYDRERRPHATQMIRLAKWMGKLVMPRNRIMAMLVHGTMALLRKIPALRAYTDELGIKPKNEFPEGLFVKGRARLKRGSQLPQGRIRRAEGVVARSDDALEGFSLLGLGQDPAAHLSAATREAWARHGGSVVHLGVDNDLDGCLVAKTGARGWCVVVRPDRVVLHDGPVADADRLVRESLALIESA